MSEPTPRQIVKEPAPVKPSDPVPVKPSGPLAKDRILLALTNPSWLNAYWELSPHSVPRAEAALKQDWHGAKLIIRLFDVTSQDTTSTSETPVKDIVIQGPGNNWYIDVPQPPRMYRADIGYLSQRGEFYVLARSNVVTPPKAGAGESTDALETDPAAWKLAISGFESSGNQELREKGDAKAIAITTQRLAAVLQETKKDEAKLKQFLEMRRLKRRLREGKVE